MRGYRWLMALAFAGPAMSTPTASFAGVAIGVSITVAPPILPVYVQPPVPGPNYIWAPGYWAWGVEDYYWVPGTWVLAPRPGLLWTPGYWGWSEGLYLWHAGYWGPHIGFYGGVNYGCGYGGVGYVGGHWDHGAFFYNSAVTKVNTTVVTNVYNKTVINNTTVNNVSFNGGNGGITAQPTAQEKSWSQEPHTPPTTLQTQHEHTASTNRALFASVNHGTPAVAATTKPGVFSGAGVVAPKGFNGTPNKSALGTNLPGAAKPQPSVTNRAALTMGSTNSNSNGTRPADHKQTMSRLTGGPNAGKGTQPGPHRPPNQNAHNKGPKKPDHPD
jgi:WXXGXW repeat (2 copies)